MQKTIVFFQSKPPLGETYRDKEREAPLRVEESGGCGPEAFEFSLGLSWDRLGAIVGHLGATLGHPAAVFLDLGAIWGRLGAILACPGAVLGPSWAILGPSWGPHGALLGPSWGHLGALLGLSWGTLRGTLKKRRFLQRICLLLRETYRDKEREAPLRVEESGGVRSRSL